MTVFLDIPHRKGNDHNPNSSLSLYGNTRISYNSNRMISYRHHARSPKEDRQDLFFLRQFRSAYRYDRSIAIGDCL